MSYIFLANGEQVDTWQSITITDAIDKICDSFRMTAPNVPDENGLYMPVRPLDNIEIYDIDDLVNPEFVGYCDDVDVVISDTGKSLSPFGRSRACDLVDCTPDAKKSDFRNVDALQIANELAKPYNVKFSAGIGVDIGPKFDKFGFKQTEKIFAILNRAFQERNLLPSTITTTGDVELVASKARTAVDELVVGVNCKIASGKFSARNLYSNVRVIGQAPPKRKKSVTANVGSVGTSGGLTIKKRNPKKTNKAYGEAIVEEVDRFRLLTIKPPKRLNNSGAEKLARWEANHRSGASTTFTVTIPFKRQSNGAAWRSNMVVKFTAPEYNLYSYEMLISMKRSNYTVSGGRTTTLTLVHPDTFTPPPKKEIKRKSAWKRGVIISSVGTKNAGKIVSRGQQ